MRERFRVAPILAVAWVKYLIGWAQIEIDAASAIDIVRRTNKLIYRSGVRPIAGENEASVIDSSDKFCHEVSRLDFESTDDIKTHLNLRKTLEISKSFRVVLRRNEIIEQAENKRRLAIRVYGQHLSEETKRILF